MRRTLPELVLLTVLAAGGLAAVLAIAQGVQLSRFLSLLPAGARGGAVVDVLVALGEVVLPVAGLLGAAMAFGRWRVEGHLRAAWSLGVHPGRLLAPVAALGLGIGLLTGACATTWGPAALDRLRAPIARGVAALIHAPGPGLPLSGGAVVRGVHRVGGGGEVWAVLPGETGATVLRAARLELTAGGGDWALADAYAWTPTLRARAGTARLDPGSTAVLPGVFSGPRRLPSAALDLTDGHQRYLWHRRWALAAAAPALAMAGALLGGAWGVAVGTVLGALAVGLTYWSLRAGELGLVDPVLGGWLPALVALATALIAVVGGRRRFLA